VDFRVGFYFQYYINLSHFSSSNQEELSKIVEKIKFKPETPFNFLFNESNLQDFILAKRKHFLLFPGLSRFPFLSVPFLGILCFFFPCTHVHPAVYNGLVMCGLHHPSLKRVFFKPLVAKFEELGTEYIGETLGRKKSFFPGVH
jgi:hypothetical protein